jgi:hypothetical protein
MISRQIFMTDKMNRFLFIYISLLLFSAGWFTGCVDSATDAAGSGISIKITSPSTNDTISYTDQEIKYTLVKGAAISFIELYINGTYNAHINPADNGNQPVIKFSLDSTYIGKTISLSLIYYDTNGSSAASDTVKNLYVVKSNKPPYKPYGFKITSLTSTSVNLSWNDSSSSVIGYEIYKRTAFGSYPNTPEIIAAAGNYNVNDENLLADSIYFYKMRGFNIYGKSEFSDEINSLGSGGSVYVMAPSNLSARATGTKVIKLTWKDNSSNENYFGIERKTSWSNFAQIARVAKNVTSYTDSANGLSIGVEYTYRVKAYSSKDSSWSSEVTLQTPSYVLANPAISSLTNTGTNTVLVQWKDNDSRYTYIYVYRRAKGEANYQLLGQTDDYNKQFEDNTVVPSQTYYYKLLSSDGTYSSDYSDSVAITTKSFSLSAPSLNTEYYAGSFSEYPDYNYNPGKNTLLTERIDLAYPVASAASFEIAACGNLNINTHSDYGMRFYNQSIAMQFPDAVYIAGCL